MPTVSQLRAHLLTLGPGFYVHTYWRKESEQYEAFFWWERMTLSAYGADRDEAIFNVLIEAVRELDSGFLLNPHRPPAAV